MLDDVRLASIPAEIQERPVTVLGAWPDDLEPAVLFLVQYHDDGRYRVVSYFPEFGMNVLSGPHQDYAKAEAAYVAQSASFRECARHFFELGRQSAMPVFPEPGSRPTLTLV